MNFLKRLFYIDQKTTSPAARFLTSPDVALKELERRRQDSSLLQKIETYLDNDIPDYFRENPIFYLARHVATPNFETLRFIQLSKDYNIDHVIGQDSHDFFTSSNPLKRALGKMSVSNSHHDYRGGGFSYVTTVDFNKSCGKRFHEIETIHGKNLISFHNSLFNITHPDEQVNLVDDAAWINRNNRGNLLEHYKRQLALFVAHGALFEFYENNDADFVQNILKPAFEHVHKTFGVKPLICNLVPPEIEHLRDWEGYPHVLLPHLRDEIQSSKKKARPQRKHVPQPAHVLA